jgi:hypothetical protein
MTDTTDWPERIEYEVNRHLGGDATVADIVALMLRLGWRPPEAVVPQEEPAT